MLVCIAWEKFRGERGGDEGAVFFFFSAWRVDWQGFLLADYNCFIRWIRGFVLFILVMI